MPTFRGRGKPSYGILCRQIEGKRKSIQRNSQATLDESITACLREEGYFQIINMETGLSEIPNTWKEHCDAKIFCRECVICVTDIEGHAYI